MDLSLVIRTDYGDFVPPQSVREAAKFAKYRKDGRPDRRTKFGKGMLAFERQVFANAASAFRDGKPLPLEITFPDSKA